MTTVSTDRPRFFSAGDVAQRLGVSTKFEHLRLFLEHLDKQLADDLTLLFEIDHAGR
jgi:hypothetical protein